LVDADHADCALVDADHALVDADHALVDTERWYGAAVWSVVMLIMLTERWYGITEAVILIGEIGNLSSMAYVFD